MEPLVIERKTAEYEDYGRFRIESRNYSKQYCEIYKARLSLLKEKIVERSKTKWSDHKILRIIDLANDEYKNYTCILAGTLYKHQELKPSILKEIAEELQAIPQPPRNNYCSPKDSIFLEDDVTRIKLVGNISVESVVTGLICGILGRDLDNGSFWVEDYCFPGPYLRPLLKTPSSCAKDHGKFILFLSGLDFVNQAHDIALELLQDWVTGMLGCTSDQEKAASIVQVIIAGNSVRGSIETFTRKGYFENKKKESLNAFQVHHATHRLDLFISYIAKSCKVILMPGEFDPSCHVLPQHPIHPQILPLSLKCKNLCGVTNPWLGKIGSRIIAGSCGQPLTNIMNVTNTENSPLEWMEKTLEWLHYAPTAPDTLAEYPYEKTDPFVIKEYPNIYFAGNMEKFETKIVEATNRKNDYEGKPIRLICIPKFSETRTAILTELESLNTEEIHFGS